MTQTSNSSSVCPHCGFSEGEFAKTGMLGCSACYKVFAPQLANLLPGMHRGTTHVGKAPDVAHTTRGRLTRELHEVELLLSLSAGLQNCDQLLDRWKELAIKLEATSKSGEDLHGDS